MLVALTLLLQLQKCRGCKYKMIYLLYSNSRSNCCTFSPLYFLLPQTFFYLHDQQIYFHSRSKIVLFSYQYSQSVGNFIWSLELSHLDLFRLFAGSSFYPGVVLLILTDWRWVLEVERNIYREWSMLGYDWSCF